MILHYLKITLRNIVKNPIQYFFIVSGIAVGIIAFSFTYFFIFEVREIGIESLPEHVRMAEVGQLDTSSEKPMSLGIEVDLLNKIKAMPIPEIEKLATFKPFGWNNYVNSITNDDSKFMPYSSQLLVVNSDFFDVLGGKIISGDKSSWGNNQAIISSSYAKKIFNDDNPIGKTIDVWEGLDTKLESYTIAGVIKDIPIDAFNADVYVASFCRVDERPARTIALLKKDSDINRINNQLSALKNTSPNGESTIIPQVRGLNAAKENFLNNRSPIEIAVLLISFFILISAIINFINLLAESVTSRIRQFTLRRIVGAGHWAIFLLMALEVVFVLLLSLLLTYAISDIIVHQLAKGILPTYPDLPLYLPRFNIIPIKVIGLVFLFCISLVLIFVYRLRNVTAAVGLRGQLSKASKKVMRNTLLIVQLVFTFILLSGVFSILPFMKNASSFLYKELPPKSQPNSVFAVPLTSLTLPEHQDDIIREISNIKGVTETLQMRTFIEYGEAFENDIPSYSNMPMGQMLPDSTALHFEVVMGDNNLVSFLYPNNDKPSQKYDLRDNEVIISQSLADKLKDYPEVHNSDLMGNLYKIAGIVPYIGPSFSPEMGTVWLPLNHAPISGLYAKCNLEDKNSVHSEILSLIRQYLPESIPYEVESLSHTFERRSGYPTSITRLAYLIATFALIIILFGVYTAVSNDTAKSRKNVAIRKINGAKESNIYILFGRSYAALIICAFVISTPIIILVLNNLFMNIPIEYRPSSWSGLLLSTICITVFILLTIHHKLNNIAKTNPVEMIKSE